jgi:hypothetical protein
LVFLRQRLDWNRSLDAACWELWWNGYPIAEHRIRSFLGRRVKGVETLRDRWLKDLKVVVEPGPEGIHAEIESAAADRIPDPALRFVRNRLGRKRFEKLVLLACQVLAGIEPELAEGDAVAFAAALGIDDGQLRNLLRAAARVLDPRELRRALDEAPLEEIETARTEVRHLFDLIGGVVGVVEYMIGSSIAQSLRDAIENPQPEDFCHFVLVWLAARRSLPDREVAAKTALAALRSVAEGERHPAEVVTDDLGTGAQSNAH